MWYGSFKSLASGLHLPEAKGIPGRANTQPYSQLPQGQMQKEGQWVSQVRARPAEERSDRAGHHPGWVALAGLRGPGFPVLLL